MKSIIAKLKQSGLKGRSGSNFPVWQKWETVKNFKGLKKYVICNASEGEPEVFKDGFILENYAQEVVEGIKLALETVEAQSAYIYINQNYYQKFKQPLQEMIKNLPIEFFRKPDGYLAGEETALLEVIEGKVPEPRLKPPYPVEIGLWGRPTLINNVETFYWVSKVVKGEYKGNRFYSIAGAVKNPGVYELKEHYSIKQILEKTHNLPSFDFFTQVGGGAIGEILDSQELNQPIKGLGAIIVFEKKKTSPFRLMEKWSDFFMKENCDKCTPCREGIYRIAEIAKKKLALSPVAPPTLTVKEKEILNDIFSVLEKTSFCPLGRMAVAPFKTAIEKLL